MAVKESTKEFLGYTTNELESNGGIHTAREISGQPQLWVDIFKLISNQSIEIQKYLEEAFKNSDIDIILTGAGTSAFIGNVLQGPFQKNTGKRTRAVATTDLVTHPKDYFKKETPTLLISFARSGNSPES